MYGRKRYVAFVFIICLMEFGFIAACKHKKASPSLSAVTKQSILAGKKLMQQYCSSCHLPVTANYLDKKTWLNHVLPAMAPKLGIKVFRNNQYYPAQNNSSAISFSDWSKIVEYFKNKAPDTLTIPQNAIALQENSTMFTVEKPQWDESIHNTVTTTMVQYDSLTHHLYSSDATYKTVYRWDKNLQPSFLKRLSIAGVHAEFFKDSKGQNHSVFTSIGSMAGTNNSKGEVVDVNFNTHTSRIIAKDLPRPVYSVHGDFNHDGLRDWIICGFGHDIGGLYLYQQQPDSTFQKKTIRNVPGAIDAETFDFNHDGWLDVMVLFAHAKEGIWMFTNDKKGGFIAKNILRFPPVYGSTSFQLVDFNKDGHPDILYTCGDNADYSKILKPYHGVYIFMNDGNDQFKQAYFYHINGTTKAIAADFDNDGDFDISTISFFADLKNNSPESFIYFEQDKPLHFIPSTPAIHTLGRWIAMDVADIDGDDDLDIILGNYSRGFLTQKNIKTTWDPRLPFIVLKNQN